MSYHFNINPNNSHKTITLNFITTIYQTIINTYTVGIDEGDTVLDLKKYISKVWRDERDNPNPDVSKPSMFTPKEEFEGFFGTAGYGRIILSVRENETYNIKDERLDETYNLYDNPKQLISLDVKSEHREIYGNVDLRGEDLSGANLSNIDLSGADLQGAILRDAYLVNTTLMGTDLRWADLRGAYLRGADLRGPWLQGSDLRGANLSGANLRGVNLSKANLSGSDLRGAYLSGARLPDTIFSGADLSGCDLRGVNLRSVNLHGVILRGVNLSGLDLSGLDLSGLDLSGLDIKGFDLSGGEPDFSFIDVRDDTIQVTNLSGASLLRAKLVGTNLSGANLTGTNLSEADLSRAKLMGADLTNANLKSAELTNANFRNVNLRYTSTHVEIDKDIFSNPYLLEAVIEGMKNNHDIKSLELEVQGKDVISIMEIIRLLQGNETLKKLRVRILSANFDMTGLFDIISQTHIEDFEIDSRIMTFASAGGVRRDYRMTYKMRDLINLLSQNSYLKSVYIIYNTNVEIRAGDLYDLAKILPSRKILTLKDNEFLGVDGKHVDENSMWDELEKSGTQFHNINLVPKQTLLVYRGRNWTPS